MRRQRISYMDSGRALLILLSVPYHAALLYEPGHENWITAQEASRVYGYFTGFTHLWRMHAFFLIAGFFTAMMLSRSATGEWLGSRLVRLGVPLLTGLFLISPIEILAVAVDEAGGFNREALRLWLNHLQTPGEHWIAHLWFLITLIALSLIAATARPLAPVLRAVLASPAYRMLRDGRAVLLLVLAAFVAWRLFLAIYPRVLNGDIIFLADMVDLRNALFYLPFFTLGALLYKDPALRERFIAGGRHSWILGVIAFVLHTAWVGGAATLPALVATRALEATASLCLSATAMFAFKAFLDTPSAAARRFADAAFTIYLVHFPMVSWLGVLFKQVQIGAVLEWLIISTVGTAAAYAVHRYAVLRIPLLAFLLNGQKPSPARQDEGERDSGAPPRG